MTCPTCGNNLDPVLKVVDHENHSIIEDYWCPQCCGTMTDVWEGSTHETKWING